MKMSERDRRDWSLLIFIVPLGILLMLIAGQFAMRIIPRWILNAGMGSSLDVETAGGQQSFLKPFFNIQILTPFAWQDTYLTPNADGGFVFPPFVVLEPSATPSPSQTPPAPTEDTRTPSPSATTVTPSPVVTTPPPPTATEVSPTTPPTTCQDSSATNKGGPLPCTYPPTTCTDPAATNQGDPLPCTYPPTTCTDPAATNQGDPLPCTYPPTTCTDPAATNQGDPLPCTYPPTTCTDPAATNQGDPLPCTYPPPGTTSTPDPTYTLVTPPPNLGVGTDPDNTIGAIPDGQYVVLGLTVIVGATPDNNYDLVFYESDTGGQIAMDWIIIGISIYADGHEYYEVFNWGNGAPDVNSNVGDVAQTTGTEDDNQSIPLTELHDPDGAGPAPQTGILIDVDNATSAPPPNTYNYVVIIAPPGGAGDPAQVDSIQATEVPIPTP